MASHSVALQRLRGRATHRRTETRCDNCRHIADTSDVFTATHLKTN